MQFRLARAPAIFLTLYFLTHLSRAKWKRGHTRDPDEAEEKAVQGRKESKGNTLWMIVAMGVYIILHKVCGSKERLREKKENRGGNKTELIKIKKTLTKIPKSENKVIVIKKMQKS